MVTVSVMSGPEALVRAFGLKANWSTPRKAIEEAIELLDSLLSNECKTEKALDRNHPVLPFVIVKVNGSVLS